jgi:choline dehydrogenase-like flavoprotein
VDPVDVLIVGAGVSGAVVAAHLVKTGVSVTCLEQGDWPDRAEYPGATPEWEIRAAKPWSSVPSVRDGRGDYAIDLTESDFGVLNFNGVGGGSVLYNAQWPRMLPEDFHVRSVDGVAEDWPLGYADLQPYYELTDLEFGVSGLGGNPRYPPGADPPLPPLPIGAMGLRVARAHAQLGWHWWPGTNAILSAGYQSRNPCVQRGSCGSGCNEGAKASTDVTHWPEVTRRGGRLVTGARVRRIVVDRRGVACGADWVDRDGHEHFQAADVVVCAANAIGTARLLLASAQMGHPDGLANSSGLVGRNLMLHPLVSVAGLFDAPATAWRAHAGALIHSLEFAGSDADRGFVRGATWALGSAGGPLRAALAPGGQGRWGIEHHENVRARLGRTASWVLIAEDLPDPENRVELSPATDDTDAPPVPQVHYRLGANTKKLIGWQIERARESLEAAGAWQIEVIHHRANGHLMGTARMGTDADRSVVDRDCMAHDVPNLMIPDGSVFVTCGSANPTSTIAAVARRAAERLVARRDEIPRPAHRGLVAGFTTDASSPVPDPIAIGVREPVWRPTDAQRHRLRTWADELIPPGTDMPAASTVGAADEHLDRVLHVRPDLATALRDALDDDRLEAGPSSAAVRYVIAAAYYLAPAVRRALEYDPERVTPVRPLQFPEYVEEGLLDHLLGTAP